MVGRRTTALHGRGAWAWLAIVLAVCGCDKKDKRDGAPLDLEERELLDPEEPGVNLAKRCAPVSGGQPVALRAPSRKGGSAAVEVGNAVPVAGGYALGVLETGDESRAQIVFVDGKGKSKTVQLGRVHGSVESPWVAADGADVLAAVVDNDAGHTRLRLARVTSPAADPQVIWGPEVQVRRGETANFSLAVHRSAKKGEPSAALLAWDDFDQSTLRSTIRGLSIAPSTMKPHGVERSLSPEGDDAVDPILSPRAGGYWATWLAYGMKSADLAAPDRGDAAPLVEEPPQYLRVQMLDERGAPLGSPLSATPSDGNVLAYEARSLPSGSLVIAYRDADSGHLEGASPVKIRIVGEDGSIASSVAEHKNLGLGAPALLQSPSDETLWLTARGYESEVLLGMLDTQGASPGFDLEGGLTGTIPLARVGAQLLTMRPDGLDLKLSVVECALSVARTE